MKALQEEHHHLDRGFGLCDVLAISMGAMIGAGLFVIPGPASGMTGASLFLAYIFAGILIFPAGLAKSELGTAMPFSGGSYIFIERSLGPWAGTVAGIGLWLSLLLKCSFALIGTATYLKLIMPVSEQFIALVLLLLIGFLNIKGLSWIGKIQAIIIILIISFLFLFLFSSTFLKPKITTDAFFSGGIGGFLTATGFVFISFSGVTKVAAIAEEIKNPGRNLPLGILLSLFIVGTLYALTALTLTNVIPLDSLATDLHPIYTLGSLVLGLPGQILSIFIAVIALTSMANAGLLAASRFPFAMGRDKVLPIWFSKISPHSSVPARSVLCSAAFCAITILTLDIASIAKLASGFVIFIFIWTMLSVIVFRESGANWYHPVFKIPAYPWILIFGIAGQAAILFFLGIKAILGILFCSGLGTFWYFFWVKKRRKRKGLLAQAGPRQDLHAFHQGLPKGEHNAVTAFFGNERSPESLMTMAHAICPQGKIEALHLQEVSDATGLDIYDEKKDSTFALHRRIHLASEVLGKETELDMVMTHDVRKSLVQYTKDAHCQWVIMAWRQNLPGSALLGNPYQWLYSRFSVNLALYREHGYRIVKKILVRAKPGPHDALVIHTANQLALQYHAEITIAASLGKEGSFMKKQAAADYIDQLSHLCHCPTHGMIIDDDKPFQSLTHATASHDLFVLGASSEKPFWHSLRFFSPFEERLTSAAHCPVLLLKRPKISTHLMRLEEAELDDPMSKVLRAFQNILIKNHISCASKPELFTFLAEQFHELIPNTTPQEITLGFSKRESFQNTSVGHGIAIPHATIDHCPQTYLGIFVLESPIEYKAMDKKKVDLIMATIGPPGDRKTHLHLLSCLAKIGSQPQLCKRIREADSVEKISALISKEVEKISKT